MNRQETVKVIRSLRRKGQTWSEVAKALNEKEMPSPRGKQWKTPTVNSFYNRNRMVKRTVAPRTPKVATPKMPTYDKYKGFLVATLELDVSPEKKLDLIKAFI